MVGLAPVAHMMFSPASRVSQRLLTCYLPAWMLPEATMQQQLMRSVCAQVDGSKGLPAQANMRGAYVNTGSRDVGPDKPL